MIPIRAVILSLLIALFLWLIYRSFVGMAYESRPRVRRVEYRRGDEFGPEVMQRIARIAQLTVRAGDNPVSGNEGDRVATDKLDSDALGGAGAARSGRRPLSGGKRECTRPRPKRSTRRS